MKQETHIAQLQDQDKFLSVKTAAEMLGCDAITIRRFIANGQLKAVKLNPSKKNSKHLIRLSAIEKFIQLREDHANGK